MIQLISFPNWVAKQSHENNFEPWEGYKLIRWFGDYQLKYLSHAGSAATSTLLCCRCPPSPSRHLPWDGFSHPLVCRLPVTTINRADLGELSLMSTSHPTSYRCLDAPTTPAMGRRSAPTAWNAE